MPDKTEIPINEELKKKHDAWDRVEILLDQDETKITEKFAIRFPNESEPAFIERKKYFAKTFINHVRDMVAATVNTLWRQSLKKKYGNENSLVAQFAENVTLGGEVTPYQRYVKDFIGVALRAYGNVFIVIDKPRYVSKNREDERNNALPYLSMIRPQNVLSWEMVGGELVWFAYRGTYTPVWEDPFTQEMPETIETICVWNKTEFKVQNDDGEINQELSFTHDWGFVPVVIQASFLSNPGDVIGNAAMDQTSNMIIVYNNLFNEGVYELFKHGGSLLLMPEDAITATNFDADEEGNPETKRQDKNGVLTVGGEVMPMYLVKELAVEEIQQWAEKYAQEAIENERDLKSVNKKGNAGAKEVQESGVAKLIDRDPLETNLIALAEDIEIITDKIFQKVKNILNEKNQEVIFEFNKDFDLKPLGQKLDEVQKAVNAGIERKSITLANEQWKNITGEIVRDPKIQETCNTEIEQSITAIEEELEKTESINNLVDSQFSNKFKKPE